MKSFLLALLLAGWVCSACAQTTQPAPSAWASVVQAFSNSIAQSREDGKENSDLKRNLADDCAIRGFDSSAKQSADLTAHTGGATLLMARAYLFPGGCIAGDIGDAVEHSQIPDNVKRALVPAEGDATTKANATATTWVQNALAANNGDVVAVVVFFTGEIAHADTPEGQILFVLIKGKRESSGTYLINQIVFGDPQQAAVSSAR